MTDRIPTAAKAALLGVLLSGVAGAAFAQDDRDSRIHALEAQVQALAAQIADLKSQTTELKTQTADVGAETADLKTQTAASIADIRTQQAATTVSIAGGRPSIASADGAFTANLHGVLQLDGADYSQKSHLPATTIGPDLNSGTNFRRARIGIDGRLFGNFDYNLLFDFGGSGTEAGSGGSAVSGTSGAHLHEGWIQYSGSRIGDYVVRARIGAFAPNLGLEDAASTNGSMFLERPSAAEIARSMAGGEQRIAGQLQSNGDHWTAAFAVTGAKTGDNVTYDEQLGFTGRIAATPFYGQDWRLHLGVNASYVDRPAQPTALSPVTSVSLSDRPELRVDGQQLISTGGIDADHAYNLGGEAAFQKGPFLVQGEYFHYQIDRRVPLAGAGNPDFHGWYAEAGWVLTGQARRYNTQNGAFDAPGVDRPFDLSRGAWGTWELAGRYSDTDLNDDAGAAGSATPIGGVRGGEQRIWAAELNWFVNADVKFALQYQNVDINRLTAAGAPAGQKYNSFAFRSQFAF